MHTLSRTLDVRTEWSLAVVLHAMTTSAHEGLTVRRTQAVVEHLRAIAESHAISPDLRTACAALSESWQIIDLQ